MIGTRRPFLACLAAVAIAGAALVPLAAPSAAASGSGSPVSLGAGDDGAAIAVHVGDTINVRLRPDGPFRFSTPTSSDGTVLHRHGGGPGHGHHHKVTDGRASFAAVSAGRASVEAIGTIACQGHHGCPAGTTGVAPVLARRWHVDVTVE